ncbi:hypothetical protein [Geobacillus subterraneus]|uniref:hypothetical protein n=1 Tax=Geobacillus subterraneus TaxID=129338 RepID=UPI001614B19D
MLTGELRNKANAKSFFFAYYRTRVRKPSPLEGMKVSVGRGRGLTPSHISSGHQAQVYLEQWTHNIELSKRTRSIGRRFFSLFHYVKVVLLELRDG